MESSSASSVNSLDDSQSNKQDVNHNSSSSNDAPINKTDKAYSKHQKKRLGKDPFNILFILTDQERYFDKAFLPEGYHLPGRERLKQRGVEFINHHIASAVCTSSRSVIYTGQHIQDTKLFDNLDFPWSYELDPNMTNIAHLLTKAKYYTAYKGKWHLSDMGKLDKYATPDSDLTQRIAQYGFKDYVGIGDVIGMAHGGWINDHLTTAQAIQWLRVRGNELDHEGHPWFLAVNLVNPHDVMFFNTDAPGQHIQDTPPPLIATLHAPETPLYDKQWQIKLPKSRTEPFDNKGRPPAHAEYQRARDTLVGSFPNEDGRWERLLNYYFNCILHTDIMVENILDELEALGIDDNTVVVLTSDHGELGGSHATHGKGATAYHEQNHVPLLISHPAYPETHGQTCQALTSHLDLVPTFMAWAGPNADLAQDMMTELHGYNLTPLLNLGNKAHVNELREGVLYCYNMWAYLDSDFMVHMQKLQNSNLSAEEMASHTLGIDFDKRGAIRSVFDGRYKFTRYFSPKHHNQPQSLDEIFELNDVQLFDLHVDPDELVNLALEKETYQDILLTLNDKLNHLINREVNTVDDGRFLPEMSGSWSAQKFDM
ncbi:sulfatase-like hydrolase/transferase [Psychrobacter sp.]|uniref:sulfatase-like hydrolase/transferase n=1 Tax=Psychrobacter sp. TaxID=56811 RepID=UPI0025FC758E|nr:sulfatase-like hydrolase/transferase [Psychrobacter sp.]